MYTELLGKGRLDEANFVFTLANIAAAVSSVIITALVIVFSHEIMGFLGASGKNAHLSGLGSDYLTAYSLGLVFMNCAKIIHGYMSIDSDGARTVYAIAAMTLVNIAGDFYVVLFTDWGMFGLGAATSLSGLAYFIVMAMHFLRRKRLLHLNFHSTRNVFAVVYDMCRQGSASAVTRLSNAATGILMNHIITLYASSIAVAVYGVQKQVMNLFGSLYLGSADTIWVMSGVYYGEEDILSLDELQMFSMKVCITLAAVCGVIICVFSEFFAGLYIGRSDLQALEMGMEAVICLAIALPFFVYIYGLANYMQGVKRFRAANTYIITIQCVIPLAAMFVMVNLIGTRGVWISTPVSAVILAVIGSLYIMFQEGERFNRKRLMVSSEFLKEEGKELELVADSMLEVSGMANLAMLFCRENGFSRRTAMLLSLCIEEMGGNIIKHGFADGKEHYIYLRLFAKEDEVILRIRDDCVPFNPLERYNMSVKNEEDPAKNVGIRMVMKLCSDVMYLSTFSSNNLIIRIPGGGEAQAV